MLPSCAPRFRERFLLSFDNKKPLKRAFERFKMAGLAGIEPATPTLKVSCSTN